MEIGVITPARRDPVAERRNLYLIRAALAVCGFLLLAPPWKDLLKSLPWSESIDGLLRGVGEAAIVALVLELLVDTPLKHRLVEEVIHQVAPRILAHLLPETVFRYIEEQLLGAALVRTSWNITYTIVPVEGRDDYVILETVSKYEMANVARPR